jgi:hemerythrin
MSSKTADLSSISDLHVMQVEHDVQIKLLSAFGDAVRRQRSMEELEEILKQLTDYTSVHFLSEQLLMRMYAYPDYEQHEQRHTQLMEWIGTLPESLAADDRERTLTTVQHLRDGILGHIEQDDAALAHYLQEGLATRR